MTFKEKRKVVTYHTENFNDNFRPHEQAIIKFVGERIARLLGGEYLGEYSKNRAYDSTLYFVPTDTLLAAEAIKLGIQNPSQLFGGCVPHAFVANKCITHSLVENATTYPEGWSRDFGNSVSHVTLRGYSTFSKADALTAAKDLLKYGEVRIKAPLARGGNGQAVVETLDDADEFLSTVSSENFKNYGVVLETNLSNETTRSIGTVTVGNIQISYCGSQVTTLNSHGDSVYGGSSIKAVRGNFNDLLKLDWSKEEIVAIGQAMIYDFAADSCFDGFYATRRNYDIAQGYDREHQFCSGVLEQSWRVGGASPAEIAAIEAFANDRELISVQTSCREIHKICDIPTNSIMYFRGEDADIGNITKFVNADAYQYRSML